MKIKFSVLILFGLFIIACGSPKEKTSVVDGAAIFKTHCQLCHGDDGKLGLNGAKDLSVSPLTEVERVEIITNGRNTMLSYANILSEEEIAAVAEYTTTFK